MSRVYSVIAEIPDARSYKKGNKEAAEEPEAPIVDKSWTEDRHNSGPPNICGADAGGGRVQAAGVERGASRSVPTVYRY